MRYFIVSFIDGNNHGDLHFDLKNYPQRGKIIEAIKSMDDRINKPTITNIIELNEVDYNSYRGAKEEEKDMTS